jgi:hypothetical protein
VKAGAAIAIDGPVNAPKTSPHANQRIISFFISPLFAGKQPDHCAACNLALESSQSCQLPLGQYLLNEIVSRRENLKQPTASLSKVALFGRSAGIRGTFAGFGVLAPASEFRALALRLNAQ